MTTNLSESGFLKLLDDGAYAWPGGYPIFFITSDGGSLSFGAARNERELICASIREKSSDGWRVIAAEVNWEDTELFCDHTNKKIESAYGEK